MKDLWRSRTTLVWGLLVVATLIAVPAWGFECLGFALITNAFPGAHVDLGLRGERVAVSHQDTHSPPDRHGGRSPHFLTEA